MRIVHRFGFSSGRKDIFDFLKGLGAAYKEGGLVSTLDIAASVRWQEIHFRHLRHRALLREMRRRIGAKEVLCDEESAELELQKLFDAQLGPR